MTLLDYFPKDFLLFVDESHVTLPQVRAMYRGDTGQEGVPGGNMVFACPRPLITGR